jgi:hypothetical protein
MENWWSLTNCGNPSVHRNHRWYRSLGSPSIKANEGGLCASSTDVLCALCSHHQPPTFFWLSHSKSCSIGNGLPDVKPKESLTKCDNLCVQKNHMWCGLFGTPSRMAAIAVVHDVETECTAANWSVGALPEEGPPRDGSWANNALRWGP